MFAGVLAGAALAATAAFPTWERTLWLGGAAAVQVRLLCNLFDGMVAVESGRTSPVGELYNEVPDRVSDGATLVGLGFAAGSEPMLGFTAALLAQLTAYVRALGKAAGAGSDFRGPMAKQQRMFVATLTALYMGLAPASWRPEAISLQLPGMALVVIAAGSSWTAWRRLRDLAARLRGGGA